MASLVVEQFRDTQASVVAAHELGSCGSWAPEHRLLAVEHGLSCSTACGSSWTRDRTNVPCIDRQILYH